MILLPLPPSAGIAVIYHTEGHGWLSIYNFRGTSIWFYIIAMSQTSWLRFFCSTWIKAMGKWGEAPPVILGPWWVFTILSKQWWQMTEGSSRWHPLLTVPASGLESDCLSILPWGQDLEQLKHLWQALPHLCLGGRTHDTKCYRSLILGVMTECVSPPLAPISRCQLHSCHCCCHLYHYFFSSCYHLSHSTKDENQK
jgi:hypothetical protein